MQFNNYSSRNLSNEITFFISNPDQLTKANSSSVNLSTEDRKYLDQLLFNTSSPLTPTLLQEHSLYQSLLHSKDSEIANLKSILSLKSKALPIQVDNAEPSQKPSANDANNKILIKREEAKNQERLNEIKKENDYLYGTLLSQSLYFKSKINLIKKGTIEINAHQSAIDAITIQHQKKSIALLDKLINLKNILNECDKALNTKSSNHSSARRHLNNNNNKTNTSQTDQ